jgi:energy-coupling factor transport system permease protein
VIATPHQRRPGPLQAARAGIGALWCIVLGFVALSFEHPLLVVAMLAIALAAAVAAGVGRAVARATARSVPLALAIALINALVVRDGITVVFRGPAVPGIGRLDITGEALAYGAVLGLRAAALIACTALLAAAVDPDALLRALRRRSLRVGVTAALATHLVGVLARDGRRLAEAQRTLRDRRAPRLAVVRAVAAGALDRATDVAATLEVRGFGSGGRAVRQAQPPSRHDLAFGASALAVAALALASGVGSWEGFEPYPRLVVPLDARHLVLLAALAACALLPFADRRGIA